MAQRLDGERRIATVATLGEAGCVAWQGGRRHRLAAPRRVAVVDTVAAGDSFTGAFAAALATGKSFEESFRNGLAAGSLACTRPGAQRSIPRADDTASLLADHDLVPW